MESASIQSEPETSIHKQTIEVRQLSAAASRPWAVYEDEQNRVGVKPDGSNLDAMRKEVLWGNLMAGGAGVEWYFYYYDSSNWGDIEQESFRRASWLWEDTRHAIDFFRDYLPFSDMVPADSLQSSQGGWCLAKPGEVYLVYLKNGGTTYLTVAPAGNYTVKWFDPRNGGALQNGSVTSIAGGGTRHLGNPPSLDSSDWAVLVRSTALSPIAVITTDVTGGNLPLLVTFDGSSSQDPDGVIVQYTWDFGDGTSANGAVVSHQYTQAGYFQASLTITDNHGNADSTSILINGIDETTPTLSLESPSEGTAHPLGDTVILRTTTYHPDGNFLRLDYFANGSLLGTALTSPWEFAWAATTPGNFSLTAVGSDNLGQTYSSTPVSVTVVNQLPQVAITSPQHGAIVSPGENILIQATAQDSDGTVASVQFYRNDNLLGMLQAQPWEWLWTNVSPGVYTINVVAIDNHGGTTVSPYHTITVPSPGTGPFIETNGLLVVEAEHYADYQPGINSSTWTLKGNTGASGGEILWGYASKTKILTLDSARLRYDIGFTTAGTYRLWIRLLGSPSTTRSVHVLYDGKKISGTAGVPAPIGSTFGWSDRDESGNPVLNIQVAGPGFHTLEFLLREREVGFDKFLLDRTPAGLSTPIGTGPAETPRDSGSLSLSLSAVHGTVSKSPDKSSYQNGELVTLTAIPDAGYAFDFWSGDASGFSNPLSIVMNSDQAITANFSPLATAYALDILATNGMVNKSPYKSVYSAGEWVTLTAAPDLGYRFLHWTGDATGTSNPISLLLNKNKVVTANFVGVPVEGMALSTSAINLFTGQSFPLMANVSPSIALNQAITWTTSDPSVATVSTTGLVLAIAEGSTVITATTVDGGFTSSC